MARRRTVEEHPETLEAAAPPADSPQPFLIGPSPAAGTPGFYMGIGSRPETPAEHATRLGASANTFADAGWMLGTLEPRTNWPAPPVEVLPLTQAATDTGTGTGTQP